MTLLSNKILPYRKQETERKSLFRDNFKGRGLDREIKRYRNSIVNTTTITVNGRICPARGFRP